ncbi:MAG: hypothetical protein WCP31_08130 [Chloroflexales bacterium]
MSRQLYRSHRMFGYEIARVRHERGPELVVLETGPNEEAVSPAHLLMPVTEREAAFEVLMRLSGVVEYARFLGLTEDAVRENLETALRPIEVSG